ncbi:hypothetical protein VCHENC02_2429B, partial [Vibrio harveyi]
SVFRRW